MKNIYIIIFIIAASYSGIVYSDSTDNTDKIVEQLRRVCAAPSEGHKYWKVTGTVDGGVNVALKFLGEGNANLDLKFTKGEWQGVKDVLKEQRAGDRKSYRDCVKELAPLFIKKSKSNNAMGDDKIWGEIAKLKNEYSLASVNIENKIRYLHQKDVALSLKQKDWENKNLLINRISMVASRTNNFQQKEIYFKQIASIRESAHQISQDDIDELNKIETTIEVNESNLQLTHKRLQKLYESVNQPYDEKLPNYGYLATDEIKKYPQLSNSRNLISSSNMIIQAKIYIRLEKDSRLNISSARPEYRKSMLSEVEYFTKEKDKYISMIPHGL